VSAEAEIFAVRMTYGAKAEYKSAGREPTDSPNSKAIVMWGWSPTDGTFGTNTLQYLKWARKQGVRTVCVDPRRTRSSLDLADEHVFIRPSTDAAALIAMAYVIASEGREDRAYCDRYVLGFVPRRRRHGSTLRRRPPPRISRRGRRASCVRLPRTVSAAAQTLRREETRAGARR
jgi:anaerobic selenocysteine-containing dehydrogenase